MHQPVSTPVEAPCVSAPPLPYLVSAEGLGAPHCGVLAGAAGGDAGGRAVHGAHGQPAAGVERLAVEIILKVVLDVLALVRVRGHELRGGRLTPVDRVAVTSARQGGGERLADGGARVRRRRGSGGHGRRGRDGRRASGRRRGGHRRGAVDGRLVGQRRHGGRGGGRGGGGCRLGGGRAARSAHRVHLVGDRVGGRPAVGLCERGGDNLRVVGRVLGAAHVDAAGLPELNAGVVQRLGHQGGGGRGGGGGVQQVARDAAREKRVSIGHQSVLLSCSRAPVRGVGPEAGLAADDGPLRGVGGGRLLRGQNLDGRLVRGGVDGVVADEAAVHGGVDGARRHVHVRVGGGVVRRVGQRAEQDGRGAVVGADERTQRDRAPRDRLAAQVDGLVTHHDRVNHPRKPLGRPHQLVVVVLETETRVRDAPACATLFQTHLGGVDAGGCAEGGRLGLRHAADGAAERVAHQLRRVTRLARHVDVGWPIHAGGAAHVASCVNIA